MDDPQELFVTHCRMYDAIFLSYPPSSLLSHARWASLKKVLLF